MMQGGRARKGLTLFFPAVTASHLSRWMAALCCCIRHTSFQFLTGQSKHTLSHMYLNVSWFHFHNCFCSHMIEWKIDCRFEMPQNNFPVIHDFYPGLGVLCDHFHWTVHFMLRANSHFGSFSVWLSTPWSPFHIFILFYWKWTPLECCIEKLSAPVLQHVCLRFFLLVVACHSQSSHKSPSLQPYKIHLNYKLTT